jgi:hypothetical protein
MRRRSIVALVSVAAGLAVAAASVPSARTEGSATAAARGPLLGFVLERGALARFDFERGALARIDPRTLRPLPGRRIEAGSGGCVPRSGGQACFALPAWTRSPGGSRLAVARNGRRAVLSLRLVDVKRLRVTSDLRLDGGPVGLLAWLAPRRLLAVQEVCCAERQRLVAVDASTGRVLAKRALRGTVLRVARTDGALVLLVAPAKAIGPARLVVADRRGAMRVVRLGRVRAGSRLVNRSTFRTRRRLPGLALDEAGRRAFVVEPGRVAEVDLDRLAVSHHELVQPAAPARRPSRAVHAKAADGRTRFALWLGGGLLAVSGADEEDRAEVRPAGLSLVDTRTWTARTIEAGATDFVVAGDLLLATGAGDPATGGGIGLAAYGFDGRERFRLFAGSDAWIQEVHRGRAYAGITRPDGRQAPMRVVDLERGRVAGRRHLPLPWLVLDTPASWWESP